MYVLPIFRNRIFCLLKFYESLITGGTIHLETFICIPCIPACRPWKLSCKRRKEKVNRPCQNDNVVQIEEEAHYSCCISYPCLRPKERIEDKH